MQATALQSADFTGRLLQARRPLGQKYLMILFRTESGLRICLCKDIVLVRKMRIGHKYHVQGNEYTVGPQTYLAIASVEPYVPGVKFFKKKVVLITSAAGLLLLLAVGGPELLSYHNSQYGNQTDAPAARITDTQTESTHNKSGSISEIINQAKPSTAGPAAAAAQAPTATTAPHTILPVASNSNSTDTAVTPVTDPSAAPPQNSEPTTAPATDPIVPPSSSPDPNPANPDPTNADSSPTPMPSPSPVPDPAVTTTPPTSGTSQTKP